MPSKKSLPFSQDEIFEAMEKAPKLMGMLEEGSAHYLKAIAMMMYNQQFKSKKGVRRP